MTTFNAPPTGTSILAYAPFFPNGQVNDAWNTWFTSLYNTVITGPVLSFNGRTGLVVPASGDYSASQITGLAAFIAANGVSSFNGRSGAVVPVSGDYPASLVPFTQAGTGAVASTVDAKLKQIINLADYGVKADGVTDDTAAVQAAFNALVPTTSGPGNSAVGNYIIYAPKGTILLSSTIAPANSTSQFELVGQGKRATVFKWNGTAGIPMFKFTNCREAVFRDFGVVGNATNVPSYGLLIFRDAGQVGAGAATFCQFHNLWVGGDSSNMLVTGIGFAASSLTYDTNNDLALFDSCSFTNCSSYGISFEHGNSLLHKLFGCNFLNCLGAAVNTVNTLGSTLNGSFCAYDCSSSGCGYTWRVGGSSHSITVVGWHAEGDSNVLSTPVSVGTSYPLNASFLGCSWINGPGSSILTFDATTGSNLWIDGGKWNSGTGIAISFPTTGSTVKLTNCNFNYASISYNNEVDVQNVYTSAGAPTYTNLGSGILRFVRGGSASTQLNTLPVVTSGTSFSASGLSNSLVILNYASATTLTSITNGYPGQIITLRAANSNATLQVGSGADQLRIVGTNGTTFNLMATQQITLQRQDAANGNTWVEISRSSPNQIYDATSGAFLYSGRIASSGTIAQWGPLNGTTTTSSFGNGAVASSLGSYIESLSSGALNVRTGTTNILAAQFDASGNFNPKFYTSAAVGGSVTSAATISPTGPVFHVTGTTTINTINLPYVGFTGTLVIIPDGVFATGTSGNIAIASTSVVSKALRMTYDGTKWYPSY